MIKTGAKTLEEIEEDSTEWGNYWNTKNSPRKLVETGSTEKWCVNNIYDLAGNVAEWTQEQNQRSYHVIRGSDFDGFGYLWHAAFCHPFNTYDDRYWTGFRAVLYIK